MITSTQIKPDTAVVCSKDGQFGVVDHMEGTDTIKLKKDKNGQHHYIPLKWVTSVDDKIHVGRPGDQVMREWSTSPKASPAIDESTDDMTADTLASAPGGDERTKNDAKGNEKNPVNLLSSNPRSGEQKGKPRGEHPIM